MFAVNVTDRYLQRAEKPPEGTALAMFCVLTRPGGERTAAALKVVDSSSKVVFEGTTKDERFDANDHLSAYLTPGREYQVQFRLGEKEVKKQFKMESQNAPFVWYVQEP